MTDLLEPFGSPPCVADPLADSLDRLRRARAPVRADVEPTSPDPARPGAALTRLVPVGPTGSGRDEAEETPAWLGNHGGPQAAGMTRAGRRAAQRYASTALAAAQGHLPHDDNLTAAPPRHRWALGLRPMLVGAAAILIIALGLVVRGWMQGDGGHESLASLGDGTAQRLLDTGGIPVEGGLGGGVFGSDDPREGGSRGAGFVEVAGVVEGPGAAEGAEVLGVVVVDVTGQVRAPNVVSLPAGSRVVDALAAAGGATAEADLAALNLARVLVDGEQVRVPLPGEAIPPPPPPALTERPSSGDDSRLVNINTADASTLETLRGIGPALAARIIEWREANGYFASVDELSEVSGIGPSILKSVRNQITVS
ncbi:MAG: helix-hairpin-helix domain-containing protein [Promicromonosporaceae bacterium]|nr:helix-hairpin-helix domain-containing protein [Promicromonosporaceae bacterium]